MEVLFACVPVGDLRAAAPWYEQLFGRPPDIVPNDTEVMWQVAGNGWLYVLQDPARAGQTAVTIAVSDLDEFAAGLAGRGLVTGPIEAVGVNARKAFVLDPDRNRIALIEVPSGGER